MTKGRDDIALKMSEDIHEVAEWYMKTIDSGGIIVQVIFFFGWTTMSRSHPVASVGCPASLLPTLER